MRLSSPLVGLALWLCCVLLPVEIIASDSLNAASEQDGGTGGSGSGEDSLGTSSAVLSSTESGGLFPSRLGYRRSAEIKLQQLQQLK